MPRLRSNKKSARYDPLFGPAQDGNTAPGYNVPRGITFEQLRELTNRARQSGGTPISVKNQIRAVVAAAGLTSAAAGALTLRAYQYVDQAFGKRPRGSDASETNADHSRLRGVKEPRTIDPELPSYEEVSSREDEFVEETGEKFGNAVETAFTVEDDDDAMQQIAREEQKEADLQGIRNVLLSMHGDTGDFTVDASDQNRDSFDDLPSGAQVQQPLDYDPYNTQLSTMPIIEDDDEVMGEPQATENNQVALLRRGGANAGGSMNYTTPVAKIGPSYPFHQTTDAILTHHGSISSHLYKIGENHYLKIRMNTYLQPYADSAGTITGQTPFTPLVSSWGRHVLGRYCFNPGSTGAIIDTNYHRDLNEFMDPLIPDTGTFANASVAGGEYYYLHYRAYTVKKCEWTVRVEVPFHYMKGTYETDDAPNGTQVKAALVGNTEWGNTPPCFTGARVFTHYVMSGDSPVSAVNPPTSVNVLEMERWDNTYEDKVTVPVNGVRVIRGTWYPGKVKHNPLNDSDMETWSQIGAVPSTGHLEHLILQFKERANSNSKSTFILGANISINLKYTVQFKERIPQIQYPYGVQTNPAGTAVNSLVHQNYGGLNPQAG